MWGGIATSRARLFGLFTTGVSGSGHTTARVMVRVPSTGIAVRVLVDPSGRAGGVR